MAERKEPRPSDVLLEEASVVGVPTEEGCVEDAEACLAWKKDRLLIHDLISFLTVVL